jgi:hypothetical protein
MRMSKSIINLEQLIILESKKTQEPYPTEEELIIFNKTWDRVSPVPERLRLFATKRWFENRDAAFKRMDKFLRNHGIN